MYAEMLMAFPKKRKEILRKKSPEFTDTYRRLSLVEIPPVKSEKRKHSYLE